MIIDGGPKWRLPESGDLLELLHNRESNHEGIDMHTQRYGAITSFAGVGLTLTTIASTITLPDIGAYVTAGIAGAFSVVCMAIPKRVLDRRNQTALIVAGLASTSLCYFLVSTFIHLAHI